jgi:hypothetical protein
VFNFLQRAATAFQTQVFSKVNTAHATCTDALTDFITTAKYLSDLEGEWHAGLQLKLIGSVQFLFRRLLHRTTIFCYIINVFAINSGWSRQNRLHGLMANFTGGGEHGEG